MSAPASGTMSDDREDLVRKAVEFLQHEKVRSNPLAQKRAFLAKKGLSVAEIDDAVARSGVVETAAPAVQASDSQLVPVHQLPPVSPWSRTRDYLATAVIIGGISYAVYRLLEKYVIPIWRGPSEHEKQIKLMTESIEELQESVRFMVNNLKEMQESMRKQNDNVQTMAQNAAQSRGPDELQRMQSGQNINEIKAEITSLKGLLLNRSQFPKVPIPQPVLPAWQLAPQTDVTNESISGAPATQDLTNSPADVKQELPVEVHTTSSLDEGDARPIEQQESSASQEVKPAKSSSYVMVNGTEHSDGSSSEEGVSNRSMQEDNPENNSLTKDELIAAS